LGTGPPGVGNGLSLATTAIRDHWTRGIAPIHRRSLRFLRQ